MSGDLVAMDYVPDAATGPEAQQIQQHIVSSIQGIRPDGVAPFGQQCKAYGTCRPEETAAKAKEFYDFLVTTFGADFTSRMLPQLVRLLPAQEKRVAMFVQAGLVRAEL